MPTGIQLNPPPRHCKQCGKRLSAKQLWRKRTCCSDVCRDAFNRATGRNNFDSVTEPYNDAQAAEFERAVAAGKRMVRREFDQFLAERSPSDDSPEAERNLREVLVGAGPVEGEAGDDDV